jgi:tRNA G10  N-methylase Trm11
MFFYRLGHIPELALAEFGNLSDLDNSKYDSKYLITKQSADVSKMGSMVYGGKICQKIESVEDLAEVIHDLYQEKPGTKKLGISINAQINSKKLIQLAHEVGFKKINILQDKEPNAGHFKDIQDWILVFEFYGEIYAGVITEIADQDIFAKLDTSMPGGNMRRGKMNLKLALSILNLANQNNKYFWDPFCGQGGMVVTNLIFNRKPIICTDLSRAAIKDLRANIEWFETNYEQKADILHIEKMDAQNLAKASQDSNVKGIIKKSFPKFDFTQTSIVTEGYLGPVFGQSLPEDDELTKILEEIENLWKNLLISAQTLEIPELVFCLPAYKSANSSPLRVSLDNILGESNYEFVDLLPGKKFVDYSRPRSRVIHQIQKVILKKS